MFWENYTRLCQIKGTNPTQAAVEMGFSSAMPTLWKKGGIPRRNNLEKIAAFFGVPVAELLSDPKLTQTKLHREEGEKIGVLSVVGAGIPMEAINYFDQDDPDSWEEISKLDAKQGPYFALRIRGNSMETEIHHGDIVIVRCAEEFRDGDMVIALVNGNEGVCKILRYRDDGISLNSLNPEYPPMIFNREQIENLPVRLVGVVEEIRRKVRRQER